MIQAKLDMATMRGQLEAERNHCLILKKQLKDSSSKVVSATKVVKGPSTFEFLKSLRQQREEQSEGEEEKRAGSSSQGRNNNS